MPVSVIYLLKSVHIDQKQCNPFPLQLLGLTDLVKTASVNQVCKSIMVSLIPQRRLVFLIHVIHMVIGQRQILKLIGSLHRQSFLILNASNIYPQRLYNQGYHQY